MGYLYKLKPEVVKFLINKKQSSPDISCRKLALEISKKFAIKLCKSSINNILKKEKLSSPVGRRPKLEIAVEDKIEFGGFLIFKAIDSQLEISKTAAQVLVNISAEFSRDLLNDVEIVFQGLLIYKSIFNVTLDFTKCYNNKLIWIILGKRPSKAIYYRVIKAIQGSQLFVEELVREIKNRLKLISSFRFQLVDNSIFFIDTQFQSIWQFSPQNNQFYSTYYKSNSYINEFISYAKVISIFNIQDTNILSPNILNFILALDYQSASKNIKKIEVFDSEDHLIESKSVIRPEKRFFLLGFWPWQLEIISEWERRPAKEKFSWPELGIGFYYQIEELLIPKHLVEQEVRINAILLKNSPLSPVRIGILTNLPKDIIHNYLSYKELYHWVWPEDRYKDFTKKLNAQGPKEPTSIIPILTFCTPPGCTKENLEEVLDMLTTSIFQQFKNYFLPENLRSWDILKIKDLILKKQALIKRSKELIIYNILLDNKLCSENDLRYICQRLNEAGIRDNQDRVLWFK